MTEQNTRQTVSTPDFDQSVMNQAIDKVLAYGKLPPKPKRKHPRLRKAQRKHAQPNTARA